MTKNAIIILGLFSIAMLAFYVGTMAVAYGANNTSVSKERPQWEDLKLKAKHKIDAKERERQANKLLEENNKKYSEMMRANSVKMSPDKIEQHVKQMPKVAEKIKTAELKQKEAALKLKEQKAKALLDKMQKFKDQNPSGKKISTRDQNPEVAPNKIPNYKFRIIVENTTK